VGVGVKLTVGVGKEVAVGKGVTNNSGSEVGKIGEDEISETRLSGDFGSKRFTAPKRTIKEQIKIKMKRLLFTPAILHHQPYPLASKKSIRSSRLP